MFKGNEEISVFLSIINTWKRKDHFRDTKRKNTVRNKDEKKKFENVNSQISFSR